MGIGKAANRKCIQRNTILCDLNNKKIMTLLGITVLINAQILLFHQLSIVVNIIYTT